MYRILFSAIFFVSINSCSSSKTEKLANDYCACLINGGLNSSMNTTSAFQFLDDNQACFQKVGKELYEIMKPMNDSQRARFLKEFTKELLDTDCGNIAFSLIPYNELLEELDKNVNEKYNPYIKFEF